MLRLPLGYSVGGDKLLVSGQPDLDSAVGISSLTSLRIDVTSLQIHRSLDGRDVGIDVQVVPVIRAHLGQDVGGLILRQSQLDLDVRRGSLDGIVQLVLLLIQIDLLPIRGNKEAILIIHLINDKIISFTYRRNSISAISITLMASCFHMSIDYLVTLLLGAGFFFRHKLAVLLSRKEIIVERTSYQMT